MNRAHFGFAGALLALALLVPVRSALADAPGDRGAGGAARAVGALTLPISGSVAGGGAFNGTVTINRFARQNGEVVAIGFVRGTITSAAGDALETGLRSVALPVTLGTAPAGSASLAVEPGLMAALSRDRAGGRWMPVQLGSCGILHLVLGPLSLDLLGLTVQLSRVTLDIGGDAPGLLGALICQLIGLLGVADVVGLLNSILELLTGLLGGLGA
jgi:hypothetical protein